MIIDIHAHFSLAKAKEVSVGARCVRQTFLFDTLTHSQMALEYLVANFAAEHVLLGSDYPYDMGDPEPVESLQKTNISTKDKERICSENAGRVLGIAT